MEECPRGLALPTPASRLWSWRRNSTSTGTWPGAGGWRSRTLCVCPSARLRSGSKTGGWSGRRSTSSPTPKSAPPARPRRPPREPSSISSNSSSSRSNQASSWSLRRPLSAYSAFLDPHPTITQTEMANYKAEFDGPILSILHMVFFSPCLCHWAPLMSLCTPCLPARLRTPHISLKSTFYLLGGYWSVYILFIIIKEG